MKKVEMYQDDEGGLWKTAKEALKRDKIHKRVKELIAILGGEIDDPGCNFANGGGYYQLTSESVARFDVAFIEALKEFEPSIYKRGTEGGKPFLIKGYYAGRALDDSGSPLYYAIGVRHTVDDQFRRWGQMYYALNPNEGKQKKLGSF